MLEKLTTALVHTLIGMGTVFVILIVISLIISAFALIPKLEKLLHGKKEEPALPVPDPEPEIVIPEDDDSDLIDMAFTVQDRVYLRQAPSVQSPRKVIRISPV